MVSRTEIGTGDGEVNYLEEGIQQYWEDEQETIAVFQSMLKSLQKLDDGVFVDLIWAMNSEYEGEDFIKKLSVDETYKVAANPLDARSFYFAETSHNPKSTDGVASFLGVQYVALDLTQFLFKKFGYYWLLVKNRASYKIGIKYTIYFFKKRPPSLWWSGGMFIKGHIRDGQVHEYRSKPLLEIIPYGFSRNSPIPKTKKAQDKLKQKLTAVADLKGYNPKGVIRNQMRYIKGGEVGDFIGEGVKTIESPFKRKTLQANAVWEITLTKPTLYADEEKDIPKNAFGVRKAGEGFSYSKTIVGVQQLPPKIENLSSLPQPYADWTFEKECEEYLQENKRRYRVIQFTKQTNANMVGNSMTQNWNEMKHPNGIETVTYEGDKFWSLFDEELVEDNRAIYQKAISFNAPAIYQYKTQFGVLNHLAV
jgi:hypothetical protein